MLQLLSATRDETRRSLDVKLSSVVELLSGLGVARHQPGENKRLCLRARLCEPALDHEDVEAFLHTSRLAISGRGDAARADKP